MKKYMLYFLLLFLVCFFDITTSYAYTYNVGTSCDSVSYGEISTGLKTYSAIPVVNVRAGEHYGIEMDFNANIAFEYVYDRPCVFLLYGTGNTDNCISEGVGGRGGDSYSVNNSWYTHPQKIELRDDTDNSIIYLKYVGPNEPTSSTSFGGLATEIVQGTSQYNGGNWLGGAEWGDTSFRQDSSGNLYLNYNSSNIANQYLLTKGNPVTKEESGTISWYGNVQEGAYSSCRIVSESDCISRISSFDSKKWTYSVTSTNSRETGSLTTVSGSKYGVSCEYSCSYTLTKIYTPYYSEIKNKYVGSISGKYVIDEEDERNSSRKLFGNRFEEIFEKFIPIETRTGTYQYYLTGIDDTGIRACSLNIENGFGEYWDQIIRYRNVDINNLFPGRQPNTNWVGYYDTNVQKKIVANVNRSNTSQPMYSIYLTPSTMRNIAKNSSIINYVGWSLGDNYNPSDISSFNELKNLGANITINNEVIQSRLKELVDNGYNEYKTEKYTNLQKVH